MWGLVLFNGVNETRWCNDKVGAVYQQREVLLSLLKWQSYWIDRASQEALIDVIILHQIMAYREEMNGFCWLNEVISKKTEVIYERGWRQI